MSDASPPEPVGLGRRAVIVLIDGHFFLWAANATARCIAWSRGQSFYNYGRLQPPGFWWPAVIEQLVPTALVLLCWVIWSATPGNLLTGTRIVDKRSGGRPALRQLLVRLLPLVVFIAPIILDVTADSPGQLLLGLGPLLLVPLSYLPLSLDRQRQAWHDKLARSLVVQVRRPLAANRGATWPAILLPPATLGAVSVVAANASGLNTLYAAGCTIAAGWLAWRAVRSGGVDIVTAALLGTAFFFVDRVLVQLVWELSARNTASSDESLPVFLLREGRLLGDYLDAAWAMFLVAALAGALARLDTPLRSRAARAARDAAAAGSAIVRPAAGWVAGHPLGAMAALVAVLALATRVGGMLLAPPRLPLPPRLSFHTARGLWVASLDGNNAVRVLRGPASDADLSPDGTTIAYTEPESRPRAHRRYIGFLDLTTGATRHLAILGANSYRPLWSPDGTRILFKRWSGDHFDIAVAALDGSGFRALTRSLPDPVESGCWSADGASVWVYDRARLHRITLDGRVLDQVPIATLNSRAWSSGWTCSAHADGQRILWGIFSWEGESSAVLLYDTRTRSTTRVSPPGFSGADPAWGPDGTTLYFTGTHGTEHGVYRMDLGVDAATLVAPDGYNVSVSRRRPG